MLTGFFQNIYQVTEVKSQGEIGFSLTNMEY